MIAERGPDDGNDIFNPFYSEEIKQPIDEQWAAKRRLAYAIRQLSEALVTCSSDASTLDAATDAINQQVTELKKSKAYYGRNVFLESDLEKYQTMASLGYELNPIDGEANPIAAPLKLWIDGDVAYGRATMGWQYEGPPNSVHGGFVAALFDQFLGVAQKITRQPGVTGTLTVRYLKPTPLCTELKLVGKVKSQEGRKNILLGEIWAGDVLTATCEALFITIDIEAYNKIKEAKPGQ